MFCSINSYNTCSNAVFRPWHRPIIVLPLVYCPADDTLFKVDPEIRCSGVSTCYCCYSNHTAGSRLILKLFIVVNGELNKVPKIISERCELVKLWDINCSSPFFLWHTVVTSPILTTVLLWPTHYCYKNYWLEISTSFPVRSGRAADTCKRFCIKKQSSCRVDSRNRCMLCSMPAIVLLATVMTHSHVHCSVLCFCKRFHWLTTSLVISFSVFFWKKPSTAWV